jgi:hypothetical protein
MNVIHRGLVPLLLCAASTGQAMPCTDGDAATRLACHDRIARCASIEADDERLACYTARVDASAAETAPVVATPPAASAERVPVAEAAPAAEPAAAADPFPVWGRSSREATPEPVQTATIETVQRDPRGIVYLRLDNGQVWRETARSRHDYAVGDAVTLSRGALGSTNLAADGMRRHAKVRRVR